MTQYVGCEQAQGLLDGLLDGELTVAEHLAVESHLRWCRTCVLRLEDMGLIGDVVRLGAPGQATRGEPDQTLAALSEAVLIRVRAERDQSLAVRLREMCADMRYLWPALGATAAVLLFASLGSMVYAKSTAGGPESLAARIAMLAPGSEHNPLRPAHNGITIPQLNADDAVHAGDTLDWMPDEDVLYTVRTVVNRDGRIESFEVLLADGRPAAHLRTREHAGHERAVFDAIQESRFVPARTPLGRAVAVDMVWVIAKTTAVVGEDPSRPPPPKLEPAPPAVPPSTPPVERIGAARPRASAAA